MLDKNITIGDFLEVLSGKEPVPGGGGASALVAAIGTGLASMTCSLTYGKKKYAEVEEELKEIDSLLASLRNDFVDCIEKDAKAFLPLANAFSLPSATDEEKQVKADVLETEYVKACSVPFEIMQKCCNAIEATQIVAEKGSRLVISDACAGILLLEAALKAASLNVYINAKYLKDRDKAEALVRKADEMVDIYGSKALEVYNYVLENLKG